MLRSQAYWRMWHRDVSVVISVQWWRFNRPPPFWKSWTLIEATQHAGVADWAVYAWLLKLVQRRQIRYCWRNNTERDVVTRKHLILIHEPTSIPPLFLWRWHRSRFTMIENELQLSAAVMYQLQAGAQTQAPSFSITVTLLWRGMYVGWNFRYVLLYQPFSTMSIAPIIDHKGFIVVFQNHSTQINRPS